jgi:hypothetical protein
MISPWAVGLANMKGNQWSCFCPCNSLPKTTGTQSHLKLGATHSTSLCNGPQIFIFLSPSICAGSLVNLPLSKILPNPYGRSGQLTTGVKEGLSITFTRSWKDHDQTLASLISWCPLVNHCANASVETIPCSSAADVIDL